MPGCLYSRFSALFPFFQSTAACIEFELWQNILKVPGWPAPTENLAAAAKHRCHRAQLLIFLFGHVLNTLLAKQAFSTSWDGGTQKSYEHAAIHGSCSRRCSRY
jgi:hypothetical protein